MTEDALLNTPMTALVTLGAARAMAIAIKANMRVSPPEFDDGALNDLWFERIVRSAVVCHCCLVEREAQTDKD